MRKDEQLDYEQMKQKALEQLRYIPKHIDTGPRTIDLIRVIVKKALFECHWIFDPSVKRC